MKIINKFIIYFRNLIKYINKKDNIIYNKEKYIEYIKSKNLPKSKTNLNYTESKIEELRLKMIKNYEMFCNITDNDIEYKNMTEEQRDCYEDGPGSEIDYIRSLGYEIC